MPRPIHLIGYAMLPTGHASGAWRHPLHTREFLDGSAFEHVASTLERGLFDMVFLPDSLHVPEVSGSIAPTIEFGLQSAIQLDPIAVLARLSGVTSRIGLGATLSTTYTAPYHLARQLASLDQLSRGRAAWNIVTSQSDAVARNFGQAEIPDAATRYDAADEVVEVVQALWRSWSEDALVLDAESGRFADPAKVRKVRTDGAHVRLDGVLSVPRSAQGEPVLMQAGSSGRGRDFAAQHAEIVFIVQHDIDAMREVRRDLRSRAASFGRDPDSLKVFPAVQVIVAEDRAQALSERDELEALVDLEAARAKVSSVIGVDLRDHPLGEPLTVEKTGEGRGQNSLTRLRAVTAAEELTLEALVRRFGVSQLTPQLVGDPWDVADRLVELVDADAADGVIVTPAIVPTTFDRFVDLVVPELQARGRYPRDYRGETLRENLELP